MFYACPNPVSHRTSFLCRNTLCYLFLHRGCAQPCGHCLLLAVGQHGASQPHTLD